MNTYYKATGIVSLPHKVKMQYLHMKQSRYIHLMSNFSSIHFHTERMYVHMFDMVDTPPLILEEN